MQQRNALPFILTRRHLRGNPPRIRAFRQLFLNNICRCSKCLHHHHHSFQGKEEPEQCLRFTEYLSQLNGVANFNLVGEDEWRVSTHEEFEEMKESVARLVVSTKATMALEWLAEKTAKALERRNSI